MGPGVPVGAGREAVAWAAFRLDIAPDLLSFRILKDGSSWSPGVDGRQARIVVEFPEEDPDRQDATAAAGTLSGPSDGGEARDGGEGAYCILSKR